MSTKVDCQTAQTAAEAALVTMQKQENGAKSNGPDASRYALIDLAAKIAEVRAQIDALI